MLDGSDSGEVNALAITKEGEHFVSGGEDKRIKVWDYDEGICYYTGIGHSGNITRVRIFILIYNYYLDCYLTRSKNYCECWGWRSYLLLAHSREGAQSNCWQGPSYSQLRGKSFIFSFKLILLNFISYYHIIINIIYNNSTFIFWEMMS